MEDLEININQKREGMLLRDKRRKVYEALKGTYVGLSTKKNQLEETRYHARKVVTVLN